MRRIRGEGLLAASLVCGVARPAFADGVFPTDAEWNRFLLLVAVVGVVALGLVFLLFRAVVRSARKEQDRIARRTVPAARVVERRDK